MLSTGIKRKKRRNNGKKRRDLISKVINGKTVIIESERLIQTKYFQWLSIERHLFRPYCFAIPNGGSRHILEAKSLQLQGVTPGIPDVFHSIPSGNYHGLYIEFKRSDKNELSPEQAKMFDRLIPLGYRCELCASLKKAKDIFDEYISESDFI